MPVPTFKGGLEPRVYDRLTRHIKKGDQIDYEPEKVPYTVSYNYKCDFRVTNTEGKTVYLESKGYFPYKDRVKMQNVVEQYPDRDIRMVFDKNNRLSSRSQTTYGDWCDKHGIRWILLQDLTYEWMFDE
jgi:hypothetical protein